MGKGALNGLLTTAIAIGTSLMTVFTQPEVMSLSDVNQLSYVVAVLGALLAGATTWQAKLSNVPDE